MDDPAGDNAKGDPDSPQKAIRQIGPMLTAGIQMAATIVAMFFIGRWLDGVCSTAPWLMIVGGLVGSAGGLISFIRTALQVGRSESKNGGTGKSGK